MTFSNISHLVNTKALIQNPIRLDGVSIEYGENINKVFRGLRYHFVDTVTESNCLALIPKQYREYFSVSYLIINYGDIYPHTDSGVRVSINVYLKANGFTTTFYKQSATGYTPRKIKNQTNGSVYDVDKLTAIGNFKAVNNEVWVLDVSEIHSVTNSEFTEGTREIITIQTNNYSFNEVLNILSAKNNE